MAQSSLQPKSAANARVYHYLVHHHTGRCSSGACKLALLYTSDRASLLTFAAFVGSYVKWHGAWICRGVCSEWTHVHLTSQKSVRAISFQHHTLNI